MKNHLTQTLQHQWISGGWLSNLLCPLSYTLGAVQGVRRLLYQRGIKSTYRAPVPVIVVGNIFVGGTGKTPLVIALIQALQARGYHPGVISRGYGVKLTEPRVAFEQAQASDIGDEPSMLANYAPIAVFPKRALACQALLNAYPQTDVIIADDGLQHLALARDIEILVQDHRGIGNGRLLPAGPLRENARKRQAVDFIVTNRARCVQQASIPKTPPVSVTMCLKPTHFVQVNSGQVLTIEQWLGTYQNRPIYAMAGIGNPNRFFATLTDVGVKPIQCKAFADHHAFTAQDLAVPDQGVVVMTQKDASKCQTFANEDVWFLQVQAQFSNPDFFDLIDSKLKALRYN